MPQIMKIDFMGDAGRKCDTSFVGFENGCLSSKEFRVDNSLMQIGKKLCNKLQSLATIVNS